MKALVLIHEQAETNLAVFEKLTPHLHFYQILKSSSVMMMNKLHGVLEVIKLGYHVIYINEDVALVSDPLPYLLLRKVDYAYSVSKKCNE